jgi:hypothetical protein
MMSDSGRLQRMAAQLLGSATPGPVMAAAGELDADTARAAFERDGFLRRVSHLRVHGPNCATWLSR